MRRVLFCASEVQPFSKTGGLADLAGALPSALAALGHDVRIVVPGYRRTLQYCGESARAVASVRVAPADTPINILETRLPDTSVPVYIVDARPAFDRAGGLYLGPDNRDWPDNHIRFAIFSRVIVEIAMGRAGVDWQPQVVHCNDWQTGLVPALLARETKPPRSVFTINNLAYQGLFSHAQFLELSLPAALWSYDAMEFNGHFAFIKGGLVYADWLVAVSPSYAEEIKTPEYGCGLEGLLRHRADRLLGIVNGIDQRAWDPAHDRAIHTCYDADTVDLKVHNKCALQADLGLEQGASKILLANIGRLAHQKGAELISAVLPVLMQDVDVQFVMLGAGDPALERGLQDLTRRWPERMAFSTAFSESLAHRIEAAADIFVMPSLYEPCGLNQMYSMRYGTVPVVRRTGGLKNTVVCHDHGPSEQAPTGFCFDDATPEALLACIRRALQIYRKSPGTWRRLMAAGMRSDFSWKTSALEYSEIYNRT